VSGLPEGFRIVLDRDTKQLDSGTLYGGSPARVLRLSETGARAWAELRSGPIRSRSAATLARRLVDAGLAHPRPPAVTGRLDLVVIIPVKDRADALARCLQALGPDYPVIIVDDGSSDQRSIAEVAAKHGTTLVRLDVNAGPAAARNAGLARTESEFVAFLDSDCIPSLDWIPRLAAQLADPSVAAAAPRVLAVASGTAAGCYSAACSSLDLGAQEALVAPTTRVSYVPTAALVARRQALLDIARDGLVFDPDLRLGEDVDLIWRLHAGGWSLRYDPSVEVGHAEPPTFAALLARRFRYGTSAGPLARRHPHTMAPLVLYPWPTITVAALLARRPVLAAAGAAASVASMRGSLRRAKLPPTGAVAAAATSISQTWLGAGRYGTQFLAPALGVLALRRRGRLAAGSLLLGPALASWRSTRPALDPVRFVAARLADEVAYGAGVWAGALHARTTVPFRPKFISHWSI
jgi:mycofactocin system glycosyltransferase